MKLTTVLFDLDGTLLPMDQDEFTKTYFKLLAGYLAPHGYEPEQLINAVWTGTKAMVANDGIRTNKAIFWERFISLLGPRAESDMNLIEDFYIKDFPLLRSVCGFEPQAAKTVRRLKSNGFRVALATNPLFPAVATEQRIRWAGLEPDDFELCTTYENISYCKPNLKYYIEILNRLRCKPEECLMAGNDVAEDMVAEKLGMRVFLITNCLINRERRNISVYPHGSFDELQTYLGLS